jgi:hypothetical protein
MAESIQPLNWRRSRRCSGGSCIEVAKDGDRYLIRNSRHTEAAPLQVDAAEWAAFVGGVGDGDFKFE